MKRASRDQSLAIRVKVKIILDGETIDAPSGISVAVALLLVGRMEGQEISTGQVPHGVFCGMGSCYGCLATINGIGSVRTCLTEIVADMQIDATGTGHQRD